MPAATEYIQDHTSREYHALEDAYAKEAEARIAAIDRAWQYYKGQMHRPLKIESDGVDDNIILPKVAEIADKLRSFLLGDGVQFDCDPSSQEPGPLDEALSQIWRANRGKRLLADVTLDGILAGHCWWQVVPVRSAVPRLIAQDPRHCSAFWDVFDTGKVLWYRLQASGGGKSRRQDYVLENETWTQYVYERPDSSTKWALIGQPERLEWLPIVDWQNSALSHSFYGVEDVGPALALNDSINLIASDYARILKHHASPRTIGLGMDAAEVVASEIGGFFTVNKPKTEAEIFNLEMTSDLKAAFDYLQFLIREAWHSGRMVDPATVKDHIGTLTNFGLRVMMHDALAKTADKRELYGEGLERLSKTALLAAGQTPPEEIAVTWPDVLPEDPAEVQMVMGELQAKIISLQTYREKRNYDHEQETQRIAEEGEGEEDLGSRILAAFEKGGNAPA